MQLAVVDEPPLPDAYGDRKNVQNSLPLNTPVAGSTGVLLRPAPSIERRRITYGVPLGGVAPDGKVTVQATVSSSCPNAPSAGAHGVQPMTVSPEPGRATANSAPA